MSEEAEANFTALLHDGHVIRLRVSFYNQAVCALRKGAFLSFSRVRFDLALVYDSHIRSDDLACVRVVLIS